MAKKIKSISVEKIEKLLNNQTLVILEAVDKRLEKMESRINAKIEKLTDTLDNFLKRLTDMEDEFEIMKADINRMKKIIKEKLGIEIA